MNNKEENVYINKTWVKAKAFDLHKVENNSFWDGVDAVCSLIDNAPSINCNECFYKSEFIEKLDKGEPV